MKDNIRYNPHIHHRRSIRLKGYDYSKAGIYFITICVQNRKHFFGHIENGIMCLNEFGTIAYDEWIQLAIRFPNIELDEMIIMPNHMHGIIVINEPVGATLAVAHNDIAHNDIAHNDIAHNDIAHNDIAHNDMVNQNDVDIRAGASPAPTVSGIIGAYKSLVANGCLDIYKMKNETMGKLWQRNYYEHIIRNDESYHRIAAYIANNPHNWKMDKFFTKNKII